jgi:predicted AlkP superfamily phosphohydrolase/phosphomutase
MNKTIVIGLDGFTWDAANKMQLPNITKIKDQGGHCYLKSTLPPVTCPAWPSFLTGKYPSKHGAYDFAYLDKNKTIQLVDYTDIKTPGLIETTAYHKIKSIFFEIPVTHPAPTQENIVVSGYPSILDSSEKFNPPELKEELENKFGKFPPISPGRYTGHNQSQVVKNFTSSVVYRKKAFLHLLKEYPWEFAASNFYLGDQFSHYFWDDFLNDPQKSPLSNAYKLLDSIVGEIIEAVPSRTNILLISDHGFGNQEKTINLNIALIQGGFLKLKTNLSTQLKILFLKIGFTPAKIKKILDGLNLSSLLSKISRKNRDKMLNSFLSYKNIDWENSQAFSFGHMGQLFWIGNDKEKQHELKNYLLALKNSNNNQLIDEIIPLRDDLEKSSHRRPLWLLKMNNWASISYPLLTSSFKLEEEPIYTGCHRPEGILAWAGPNLKNGKLRRACITDLAPTIHSLLGIPQQEDFDGRILKEIITDDILSQKGEKKYSKQINNSPGNSEQEERVEQLKNMGYL